MNRAEVERLLKLAEEATPGPWHTEETFAFISAGRVGSAKERIICQLPGSPKFRRAEEYVNLRLIGSAREAVPNLCRQLLDAMAMKEAFATLVRRCETHGRLIGFHGDMLDEAKAALSRAGSEVG